MPVTSLKVPEDLKKRVAAAAAAAGKSAHAFMVDAIAQQTLLAEARVRFVHDALAAEAETVASGKVYPAADVHDFVVAKARKRKVARPKAKAWR
jgi:predicted transcriptional regulator